jgi:hypothetical protein
MIASGAVPALLPARIGVSQTSQITAQSAAGNVRRAAFTWSGVLPGAAYLAVLDRLPHREQAGGTPSLM